MRSVILIYYFLFFIRHHQCKRVDVLKALKKRGNSAAVSCTGKLVPNYNPKRIPQMISEIVCPAEMGDRCTQLVLPMDVFISGTEDQSLQKIIYIPSGCIDNKHINIPANKKTPKSGRSLLRKDVKKPKSSKTDTASIKITRRRRYVISQTELN
jgi:hypothetical protein